MNEDILINITPQETRVALVLQGAVQELHIERTLTRGLAALFVEHIDGSHSGIMGLPLYETAKLLRQAGIPLALSYGSWVAQ